MKIQILLIYLVFIENTLSWPYLSSNTFMRMKFQGEQVLNLYVTEYLHAKYPNIPTSALKDAVAMYTSVSTLSTLSRRLGVTDVMLWKSKVLHSNLLLFAGILY
jgi:dsRNA-specific ribonuclease